MKKDTVTQVVFLEEAMKVRGTRLGPGRVMFISLSFHLLVSCSRTSPALHFGHRLGDPWISTPGIPQRVRTFSEPAVRIFVNPGPIYFGGISGSTFLQQTLSAGYPKLLRLFQEFFAKIAVHTDTVYSLTYQRYGLSLLFCVNSPVLMCFSH